MANTLELIASSTVGSGGASDITFSSIPSTFTDLCVKYSVRGLAAYTAGYAVFYLNGDTSTSYSARWAIGDGSSVGSGASTGATNYSRIIGANIGTPATANIFTNGELYIPNYAGSVRKSATGSGVGENNGSTAFALITANLYPSTSAVTSLTIVNYDAGGLAQYSSAYLYGIKNS